jgi:hypothetical protein
MCTLTIVPVRDEAGGDARAASGVRIACNRDESRLRPAALPPELRQAGPRRLLMPVDPVGGGTWIGASDAALALVLMNVYTRPIGTLPLAPHRQTPATSRGTIIPHVAAAATLAEGLERARSLDLAQLEPFRLVLVDLHRQAEVEWSDSSLKVRPPARLARPWFCTSSGLGDEIVAAPRRQLFAESFAPAADWIAAQDRFHRHQWPDRRPASVWMTRPEARTVSLTVIEMDSREVRFRYYAREGDDSPADVAVEAKLSVGQAPRA